MLTINKTDDMDLVQGFLKERMPTGGPFIFMAGQDGGALSAIGWLALKGYRTYLDGVACAAGKDELLLVVAKALLNYADLHHITVVYGDRPDMAELYRALGFRQESGQWLLSLEGYFTSGHC